MIAYPGEVFDKLEPAVTRTAALPAYLPCEVSIAISLKRIADSLADLIAVAGGPLIKPVQMRDSDERIPDGTESIAVDDPEIPF